MPTNTDLVKDLPADFDIFGQAVDDRIKALNPETTAGDISYRASTANAKSRLPIGTANQLLRVNSSATAPEWFTPAAAGGMTLINTGGTTLTGASVSVTSIPGTYKDLIVLVQSFRPVTDARTLMMQFNSDTTNSYVVEQTGTFTNVAAGADGIQMARTQDNTATNHLAYALIPSYANSSTWKLATVYTVGNNATTTTNANGFFNINAWLNTSAITSVTLKVDSGDLSGGTVYVYGVS